MRLLFILLIAFMTLHSAEVPQLKVAIIGGMTMSGFWQEIEKRFESKYAIKLITLASGPKHILDEACRSEDIDLVTMHASDTISDLVADGGFVDLMPWVRNRQAIIGPKTNPANIKEGDDVKTILEKIVSSKAKFLLHDSSGSMQVLHVLIYHYNIAFASEQILYTQNKRELIHEASRQNAYTIFGQIPFLMKKQFREDMKIYSSDERYLQRPYLVAIGSKERIGERRYENAKKLQEFLLSSEIQKFIKEFQGVDGEQIFFPIK
ncbi:MAG: substrate-binding domain-containing protein [Sulfurimonas sp.]|nr:substrate-binding domain-containing protein [Sulfurimonas sp.]MDD5202840.1 substrate-binding domain-containing protein [Sulfurimonas sp.]